MVSYLQLLHTCLQYVFRGQLPPPDLLKIFISKSLGFGILAGACITKVPQITAIVRSGSAEGLNPLAFELETLGLMIHTAYGALSGLPFNAYGEAAVLFAQNLAILGLIYHFSRAPLLRILAVLSFLLAFVSSILLGHVGLEAILLAFDANSIIMMFARLPQIVSNWRSKNTGQLSLITNAINVLGCVARIFTSVAEQAGPSMIRTYILSLLLNGLLVIQIIMYSKSKAGAAKAKTKAAGKVATKKTQ